MVVSSISDMENKKLLAEGMREWMRLHQGSLRRWMSENVSSNDRDEFTRQIFGNDNLLYIMYLVLRQAEDKSLNTNEKRLIHIARQLCERNGLLWIILGAKGSGKTSLLHTLAETAKRLSDREVWWYGPPASVPAYVDDHTMDENRIPSNSIVLLDESSILFFNRVRDPDTDDFMRKLPTLRHTDKNYIFCTQCLPKNQEVITQSGVKPLKDFSPIEKVLSFDFNDFTIKKSIAFRSPVKERDIVEITLEDDTKIKASPEHKWFVFNENGINVKQTKHLNGNDHIIIVSNDLHGKQ